MKKFCLITFLICVFPYGFGLADIAAQNREKVIMEEKAPEPTITVSENRLIVKDLPQDGLLEVYSIVGVKVYSLRIKAGTNEYPLNLPKGLYIIRIGKLVKKIALK